VTKASFRHEVVLGVRPDAAFPRGMAASTTRARSSVEGTVVSDATTTAGVAVTVVSPHPKLVSSPRICAVGCCTMALVSFLRRVRRDRPFEPQHDLGVCKLAASAIGAVPIDDHADLPIGPH
jgi:hypothetical protein